jgi:hypothetical protein
VGVIGGEFFFILMLVIANGIFSGTELADGISTAGTAPDKRLMMVTATH